MEQILEKLKVWREDRSITHVELDILDSLKDEIREAREALDAGDIENYVEEAADVAIFIFNWIGVLNLNYGKVLHGYEKINLDCLFSLVDSINIFLPVASYQKFLMIINLCKDLVEEKGYSFEKVVLEKIKVVSSRTQCPIQKEQWEKEGAKGKWLKDKSSEAKALWYTADYSKCKIV